MPDAVIIEAIRTPIGKHGGALKDVRPDDLAAHAICELVRRTGVDPSLIDEIYFGCANQAREEQDAFALASHQRAVAATDSGHFAAEIVPVPVPQKKGEALVVDKDEQPRRDTSLEKLAALKPAFRKGGTVTAGNASSLNDG